MATVSRALRGLAHVDPATRERVLATAERLGYTRDPLLSTALSRARRSQQPIYKETIVFLVVEAPGEPTAHPWKQEFWEGIERRAAQLGYKAEKLLIPLSEDGQRRFIRRLHARGIRGVIFSPQTPLGSYRLIPEWQQFRGIEIAHTLEQSYFPRVDRLIHDDMQEMLVELKRRGYRRIGLALVYEGEAMRRWPLLAETLSFTRRDRGMELCGILWEDGYEFSPEGLAQWIRFREPEVIIVNGMIAYEWLHQAGWKFPEDVGLCRVDTVAGRPESGMTVDYIRHGQQAVSYLASLLEHERGSDEYREVVIGIPSRWHEGTTLRPGATD